MTDEEVLASLQPDADRAVAVPSLEDSAQPNPTGAVPVAAAPGVDLVPPPDFGPPKPDATDAILAQTPPAPAGIPTRDPLAEWPPGAPTQPPAAEPAPGGDVGGALQAAHDSRKESNDAQVAAHEGEAEVEHARAEEASKRARLAEEHAKQEQAIQKQYADADAAAQAQIAQTQAALKDFKFRDLWDSKSTVQKIGSALSTALLAIGAGMMKTPKYAIEILDKEMDDDHKRQVEHLNMLKDNDVMARTGLADSHAARTRALADLTLADAQKDRVIAAQFDEVAARAKDQNSGNEARAYAAKLKQEAADKDVQAQTTLRNFAIQDASAKAKADEAEALARLHNTQAAAGGYNPNTGRGRHGAGGGGGGGGSSHGETLLMQKIEDYKKSNGNTMPSQATIYGWADDPAIKLPHEAKAGHPSVANVLALTGKMTTTDASGKRADLQERRFDESAVKNFASEHQLPKLEAAHRKLEEVRSMLNSGNPVAAMSALMEYDAAAKGSSATESSMHAIQGRLGGAWDRFRGAIARQDSGAFGETERKNLAGAIDAGLSAFKESVEPIHHAFGSKFDYSQPGVKQAAASLFEPFGYRGGGGGRDAEAAPQGKRVRLKDGRVGTLTPDNEFHQDQ